MSNTQAHQTTDPPEGGQGPDKHPNGTPATTIVFRSPAASMSSYSDESESSYEEEQESSYEEEASDEEAHHYRVDPSEPTDEQLDEEYKAKKDKKPKKKALVQISNAMSTSARYISATLNRDAFYELESEGRLIKLSPPVSQLDRSQISPVDDCMIEDSSRVPLLNLPPKAIKATISQLCKKQLGSLKLFNPTTKADLLRKMEFHELTTQVRLLNQDSAPTLVRKENSDLVPLIELVFLEGESRLVAQLGEHLDCFEWYG